MIFNIHIASFGKSKFRVILISQMVTYFIIQYLNIMLVNIITNFIRKVIKHYKSVRLTEEIQTPLNSNFYSRAQILSLATDIVSCSP